MLKTNVETFLGCEAELAAARIVIFGAPFDSTTSFRPGTRFASKVMRGESYGLETYSPYQDLDMEDALQMTKAFQMDRYQVLESLTCRQPNLF